jgi:hypothetical protein
VVALAYRMAARAIGWVRTRRAVFLSLRQTT